MTKSKDLIEQLLGSLESGLADLKRAQTEKSLRKMLQQALDGERRALKRAEEAESALARTKRRAQNNIDRAFNRGVSVAGGDATVRRIVRHPEFGTE